MGLQRRLSQLGFGVQSGKGVAATGSTQVFGLSEGTIIDIAPDESPINLTWLTRVSEGYDRKAVKPVVSFGTVVTPLLAEALMYAALGSNVTTGSGAPYSHAATPAADLPYLTVFGKLAGRSTRLVDAKLDELELSFDGAGRLTAKGKFLGCTPDTGTSWDSTIGVERVSGGFLAAAGGTFLIDSTAFAVQSGSVKIANHCAHVPVANSVLPSDVFPGMLDVTYSMKVIPDDPSVWNRIAYDDPAGVSGISVSPYFGPMSLKWVMNSATDLTVAAPLTRFASKYPDSNPAGGPAEITVEGNVVAPVTGATVTATTRNSQAT